MTTRTTMRLSALLALSLGVGGWATVQAKHTQKKNLLDTTDFASLQASTQDPPLAAPSTKRTGGKLAPGEDDPTITRVVTQLLSQSHYSHQRLNKAIASKTLDQYLDTLDPRHLYFLQSDLAEFAPLRDKLDVMLMKNGDTSPADMIFARLLQRIDQQSAYVNDLLKTSAAFDFTANDSFVIDRKNEPRPANVDEAKALWKNYLRFEYLQEKLNNKKSDEIVKTLTRRYSRNAKTLHDYDGDDVYELFINSLAHVYDPHTDYLGKSALDQFNIQMRLSLFGIGAVLQSEDGYCKIQELTPGGPADRSGKLKAGDRVVAVAQGNKEPVDVVDTKLDKVVEQIRGPKGTEVRLTIIPAGAPDTSTRKVVTLIRDEVKLESQEAKARIIDTPNQNGGTSRLGVIDLPSFYSDMDSRQGKSTTTDVAKLIKKLKAENVSGIVLDLRGNPGGSLQEVIKLTGLFIKSGPVVQVRDSEGTISVDDDDDPGVLYDGPLVVMTSKLSASASEILAGALQDYGRAVIIGDKSTYGKGTVQTVAGLGQIMQQHNIPFHSDPGALKITIQKFYRPSGASTQKQGVVSDIMLPTLTNYIKVGEDTQPTALPYDVIPSATFTKDNRIAPMLDELKRRSQARITADKDFAALNQEISLFKSRLDRKSVSLNEAERRREKAEDEARAKSRKKELADNTNSKQKVYLITLRNADKPGLPDPVKPETATKKTPAEKAATDDPELAAAGESTPAVDLELEETERILMDAIVLTGHPDARAARR